MSRLVEQQPTTVETVGYVSCTMQSGESVSEFIARAAAAHGPLSDVEIVRLRAIFQPADTKAVAPPASLPAAA